MSFMANERIKPVIPQFRVFQPKVAAKLRAQHGGVNVRPVPSQSQVQQRVPYIRQQQAVVAPKKEQKRGLLQPIPQPPAKRRSVAPPKAAPQVAVVPARPKVFVSQIPRKKPIKPHAPRQNDTKISTLRGVGKNKILIMVSAGPSITEVDFTPLKNHPSIDFMCINKPYPPVWPSKYWAFCDNTQYVRNVDLWNAYEGTIINSYNVKARKSNQIIIHSVGGRGWSYDVSIGYHIGRSSTFANMQVAHYMNYDKVYIFGCDMAQTEKLHWYGQNPDVDNVTRAKRFQHEADNYQHVGEILPEEVRRKFYFCSSVNPWSFTGLFNKRDHKTAIQEILRNIPEPQK